jgi:hypothetical protein
MTLIVPNDVFPLRNSPSQTEQPAHQLMQDRQQHPAIIHDRPEHKDRRSDATWPSTRVGATSRKVAPGVAGRMRLGDPGQ